jgi:penicillin-binding protein 2
MLEATIISVIVATILGLIAISILHLIDAREQKGRKVKNEVNELGAGDVIDTKVEHRDLKVPSKERSSKKDASFTKRLIGYGVAAGGIFVLLASRIANMQLFNQSSYEKAANDNQFTTVNTPSARGSIRDRNGRTLVYSENHQAVVFEPDVSSDEDTMKKVSTVLGIPYGVVRNRALSTSSGAQSRRVIACKTRDRDVAFILEHKDAFPGVFIETRPERKYVYGALAGHVLGYTGYPTQEEVDASTSRQLYLDVVNGKSGIEKQYDSVLAGEAGQRDVRVDADGNIIEIKREVEAVKGNDLILTLDAHAQYVADNYLREKCLGKLASTGAVVCMDIETGGIVAMASFPTYDPNNFTGGIPEEVWNLYSKEESKSPMLNRAISSGYAPGSTMKAFSSMAGLNYGYATTSQYYYCKGEWDGFGTGDVQKCWNENGHGGLNLRQGIVYSCDVVFYEIAKQFYLHGPEGSNEVSATALQEYYNLFGLGSKMGIDLADEAEGRIPTPAWKAERWKNVPANAQWYAGDYSNMIIGQGDVLVTPLQLACAYGCVASGKLMKPHLVQEVRNSSGDAVLTTEPEVISEPNLNKSDLEFVREALRGMVRENTAVKKIFDEVGLDCAGKTGTAEHANEKPDALFVGFGPYDSPKYVCACVLQHGNDAQADASPIVAHVLKAAIDSQDNGSLEANSIAGYAGEALISGSDPGASLGSRSN